MNPKDVVLPYRAGVEDLNRLIEARARGRELTQIQSLNFSPTTFHGTLLAAYELGLLNGDTKELTAAGREYALLSSTQKPSALLKALLKFEPYDLLLEAIFDKGDAKETTLEWVEKWWSTHGYGNSQTNRVEGAYTLARFMDYVGLGTYIQGRRGHVSRIQWSEQVGEQLKDARAGYQDRIREEVRFSDDVAKPGRASEPPITGTLVEPNQPRVHGNSLLLLPLSEDRTVEISLPPKLTLPEKARLLALIELMITVEEPQPKGDQQFPLSLDAP